MESRGCKFPLVIIIVALTTAFTTAARGAKDRDSQHIVQRFKVDGTDTVDCVPIYKQPALDHPLLVNHTIQIHPSTRSSLLKSDDRVIGIKQSWYKYGRCPSDSIPITRHHSSTRQSKRGYGPPAENLGPEFHQHSIIRLKSTRAFQGIHATLNIWNPTVNNQSDYFSLSQLWLTAGSGSNLNTMEVGWHVYPSYYEFDTQPRLFIYWTSDGYNSTGCYNIEGCPGFVQTNSHILIGGTFGRISSYDGQQAEIELSIEKDTSSGNWWLYVAGEAIGYWPQSLFNTLANTADSVEWGGEAYDSTGGGGLHSGTQMGSGHFSAEGYQKASYIRGITYTDTSGSVIKPPLEKFQQVATTTSCYDLSLQNRNELHLFFGGPGCTGVVTNGNGGRATPYSQKRK